jgi:hypothetical protein
MKVYVVVAKGVLVFASTSEKWARNVMVTLAHVKPKLAGQIVMGTAVSDTHFRELVEAFGKFPVWVDDLWPKTTRRVHTVILWRGSGESASPIPLFDTLSQKGAYQIKDTLKRASFSADWTTCSSSKAHLGQRGFALLQPA